MKTIHLGDKIRCFPSPAAVQPHDVVVPDDTARTRTNWAAHAQKEMSHLVFSLTLYNPFFLFLVPVECGHCQAATVVENSHPANHCTTS
jgi:hypothetical protein